MAASIEHVYVPNVNYPSLFAAFEAPDYQTPQGRMALARYWVEVHQIDVLPGFECDQHANAARLKSIVQNCQPELRIASDEHLQAMINHRSDKQFESLPRWLKVVIKVIGIVVKPFVAIMNALDRTMGALDRILPAGRAGKFIRYGAGLLLVSGGFYFVGSNPPLAVVIGTGLGAATGTALLCAGIYLAIKQKYYQGRQ